MSVSFPLYFSNRGWDAIQPRCGYVVCCHSMVHSPNFSKQHDHLSAVGLKCCIGKPPAAAQQFSRVPPPQFWDPIWPLWINAVDSSASPSPPRISKRHDLWLRYKVSKPSVSGILECIKTYRNREKKGYPKHRVEKESQNLGLPPCQTRIRAKFSRWWKLLCIFVVVFLILGTQIALCPPHWRQWIFLVSQIAAGTGWWGNDKPCSKCFFFFISCTNGQQWRGCILAAHVQSHW